MNKFRSCYHKCMKALFCVPKYSSVTTMLLDTGLPSSITVMHNACISLFLSIGLSSVHNIIVIF